MHACKGQQVGRPVELPVGFEMVVMTRMSGRTLAVSFAFPARRVVTVRMSMLEGSVPVMFACRARL